MAVYMIRAGDVGPIKIGSARDPVFRMQTLQTSHYLTLQIVRVFEGGPVEEYALHKRFAHLSIRGEWFADDPALMGDVGLVETTVDEVMKQVSVTRIEVPPGYDKKAYRSAVAFCRKGDFLDGKPLTVLECYARIMAYVPEQLPMVSLHD